mmetsp:Transcript_89488/g.186958  ORF Transcript_89488/g.186958 Transcript_89488/m.186958 type:complete len:317 (+) Transcript_89488:90-1040(+)|eukprot:CAMPEP_0206449262 /NCGR_PEP_ID=MMETSP0324_2-20121206/17984_1 /ASSEMBLY_ACC=CAM_ASM_000836 /TAXON_ID=2866 /ORGANISM="Crypthecodinium cohnii, Strain Seligo" /LENGTH=316 /DNA_ID=CAMNT_0053918605 /DNA_START=90 /DNA_END=1040 /DNA_ORIENTATION=-
MPALVNGKRDLEGKSVSVVKGIVWPSSVQSEAQLEGLRKLPCRSDDIFVATYPKCGTHWVHKLCNLIVERDSHMLPAEFNRWDLNNNWHLQGPKEGNTPIELRHEDMPSPRVVSLHTPADMLPADAERLKCPVVCVVRDPKDTLVSYYHFSNKVPILEKYDSLEDFAEIFLAGASGDRQEALDAGCPYGGYANYVLGFVEAAREGRLNVHFVSYEQLLAQPAEGILALAKFLGKDLTPEQATTIAEAASFNSMKQEAAEKDKKTGGAWSNILYRSGTAGDGSSSLDPNTATKVDEAFSQSFQGLEHLFAFLEKKSD